MKLFTHMGYHKRKYMQNINTGQLIGGRTGGYPHYGNRNEIDVTCKVENHDGKSLMYNGIFKFNGCPALGVDLDHEALFIMEYGYPEGEITLFGFKGRVHKIRAWINTVNGSQAVLKATFQNSIRIEEGDSIPVAGPELRYIP